MRVVAAALASTVLLASCGSSTSSPDASLPDADDLVERAEELGISPLALALDQTVAATAFRVDMAIGLDMTTAGQQIQLDADLDNVFVEVLVDADGEEQATVDLGPMMTAMAEQSGASDADLQQMLDLLGGDLSMQTWRAGDTMVLDLGGFSQAIELAGIDLPEGRFSIDVGQLGERVGMAEVASTITGSVAPDPVQLAIMLRERLVDAEGDGTIFSGTIGYLDFASAFGQDPTAAMSQADLDGSMLDTFEQIEVDVDVTIADGAVDLVRFDVDLTPVLAEFAGADETAEMTMLFDYDLDPTIDVDVPTGVPDATQQFLDVYGSDLAG